MATFFREWRTQVGRAKSTPILAADRIGNEKSAGMSDDDARPFLCMRAHRQYSGTPICSGLFHSAAIRLAANFVNRDGHARDAPVN
jgi:hypothetical protein